MFPSDKDEYEEDNDDEDIDTEDNLLGVEESVSDMLELFYQFLISPDSCNQDPKSANDCKMRVFRILKIVESTLDIQALVDRKGIRDVFFKNCCMRDKHLNPRTIQSYFRSLQHFYDFVKSENLTAFDKEIITSMESRVQTRKKGYTNKVKIADMAKMEH